MSNRTEALKRIKKLIRKYGKGGYIFRGTTSIHSKDDKGKVFDGISSTLYRWAMKEEEDQKIPNQKKLFREALKDNPHYSFANMENEIVGKANRLFSSNTANHEILTELQHFGGNTNMIDFSHSLYVALFFACQKKLGEDGEIIALSKENLTQIRKIDYPIPPQKGTLEIIFPAGTQSSRQRVHFQSSIFVRPADGYINRELCKVEKISANLKKPILEYLRIFHNLTANTVYNDLHGFIENEKNDEVASLYFNLGLANQSKDDFKKAILYYGKCIKCNPNTPNVAGAYNNRGVCYNKLGKKNLAFRGYSKALSLKPDFPEAYNNRGNFYYHTKKYDLAIKDYDRAILLRADFPEAYNNRGNAYSALGEREFKIDLKKACSFYNLAIKDYSDAIKRKDDFAEAYHNRGLAKEDIGDKKGANADFAKAAKLGYIPPKKK